MINAFEPRSHNASSLAGLIAEGGPIGFKWHPLKIRSKSGLLVDVAGIIDGPPAINGHTAQFHKF